MKTLNILIGIVGSGKSTMAKKLAEDGGVILSSDDVRAELAEKTCHPRQDERTCRNNG